MRYCGIWVRRSKLKCHARAWGMMCQKSSSIAATYREDVARMRGGRTAEVVKKMEPSRMESEERRSDRE